MTHHWGSFTDDPSEDQPHRDTRAFVSPRDDEINKCPACGKKVGGFMDDTIGECRACRIKREQEQRSADLRDEEFRREQMHRDRTPDKNVQEDSEGYSW